MKNDYALKPSKELMRLVEDYNKPLTPFDADTGLSQFSRIREMAASEGLACITTPAQVLYIVSITNSTRTTP